jgi:hypothetical protein
MHFITLYVRTLVSQAMMPWAPLSVLSHVSQRWAASVDEPIGLVQHHRVNRESQGFGDL